MNETARQGEGWVIENPFTPEEEWIRLDEFAARQRMAAQVVDHAPGLRITKIDFENKTVTLE